MSETRTQEIARRLRLEAAGIGKAVEPDVLLCADAADRLETLESALITMLSSSQLADRSHDWVKQAETKAQDALA